MLMVTVGGTAWLIPLFRLLGVVTWWSGGVLAVAVRVGADRGPWAGAGPWDGLQRVSIGVNVCWSRIC